MKALKLAPKPGLSVLSNEWETKMLPLQMCVAGSKRKNKGREYCSGKAEDSLR